MPISTKLLQDMIEFHTNKYTRWIEKTDTCWIWHGRKDKNGMPLFTLLGRTRTARVALHWFYKGDISPGYRIYLQPECDPSCVNPDHFIVSKVSPKLQKLDEDKVAAIRSSRESEEVLAKRFNVTKHAIRDVRAGRTWS